MKIYLDIDGTLVGSGGKPAKCLREFLEYATEHHDCYWLTTHCKGSAESALAALRMYGVDEETLAIAEKVRATDWDVLKTDAIDMKSDFVWFDDSPMASELLALERGGLRGNLYEMNTRENPDAVCEALAWLQKKDGLDPIANPAALL